MTREPDRLAAALADRYLIERKLGEGGMATVYLAEDLRHKRKVALKVLKPELAAVLGGERFVKEITTTASLQHPHILPLFDSGTADGFLFYVMPYIEGETLRAKLDRETQLGVEEAVRIAREVADALDYAHRNGIVHRDIKPENILLHDGRPVVADFGIALAVSAAAGGRMTETGTSVGTPHYMSPEQATADKEITGRSDQYSLASVLYEMLAGEPPHTGATSQAVIMKIIAEPVKPVSALRKSVPRNVVAAVSKALEKLPADRFDSARAFSDALANPHFTTPITSGPYAAVPVRDSLRSPLLRGAIAIAGAAILVAVWALTSGRGQAARGPVVRAEVDILTRSDSAVFITGLDISPDGSAIAYSARRTADPMELLYVRRLQDRAARAIQGTEGASAVTFSPDGQSIAFVVRDHGIRSLSVEGGGIQSIVNDTALAVVNGLRWATDGYLYYDHNYLDPGLSRVPANGGTPEVLLRTGKPGPRMGVSRGQPVFPDPLPDGRHVLYTECCQGGDVRVLDLETGTSESLGLEAAAVQYLPGGYLLLTTAEALVGVAFDARRLAVRGEPFSVLDSVTANGSVQNLAVSSSGTAVYTVRPLMDSNAQIRTLARVDMEGHQQRLPLPAATYGQIAFSPDGRRIASFTLPSRSFPQRTLFVHDLLIGTTTRRSTDGLWLHSVIWTPDDRLLFAATSLSDSAGMLLSASAGGTGVLDTLLTMGPNELLLPRSFAPDGRHVLFERGILERGSIALTSDLVVAELGSTLGPVTNYLAADWSERGGALSPDGRWVAYASNEEDPQRSPGRTRVYARTFPEPGRRFTVSDSLGAAPRWSRDGRTIYYFRGRTLVSASVQTTPTFSVTSRRDLFTVQPTLFLNYDVDPDGAHFAMTVSPVFEPQQLVLVVNWIDEFNRKLEEGR